MDIMAWQSALYSVWISTIGSVFELFPHILGAILVATVGIIIGNWVKTLTVKSLQMIRLENLIKDSKFKAFLLKAEITEKVEEVIGSIFKWLIVLTFFIAATNILGLTTVSNVLVGVLGYVPNVISAVIVMAIGGLLAGIIEGVVKGALASVDLKTGRLMGKIASYTVVTITTLAAFSELKIASAFINILFIATRAYYLL
jgi:F0F1-type ATP synthase membrane subunit c/vacuolar-type H+-ATPase subunit K